ncbi:MAG: radical SAM family heme chaperone HemW [Gemmatimonadetes bacterium]|nr:radical SAM family heme chaperone HemW [Gemmatimonadota bacterium]
MTTYQHVYVHVPFCARRCVYCDFSIAVRREVPASAFTGRVARELALREVTAHGVDTLYFGGGTPSRLGGEGLADLVRQVASLCPLSHGAEVTVEANPEDVNLANARAWAAAGVNRVSLGVQSFDPRVLAWMHRGHDAARVQRAVDALREAGIANLSLDLIYALPVGLERDWSRDLDAAIALRPNHISCYGLTVEPQTPLGRQVSRGTESPSPEEAHELEFLATHERLTRAGFDHYEVSNYALPAFHSRHNSSYWSGVAYLGLGPSAHGFDGVERRWNRRALAAWERDVDASRDPLEGAERLSADQHELERVYLDLRTTRGLLTRATDAPMISSWMAAGWATGHGDRIRLTPLGWLRLDALVAALTDHRSRY